MIEQENLNALLIKEIIESQANSLSYEDRFTLKHKLFVYQAFKELLLEFPDEMVEYLMHSSRTGGFQHKVFQKYISLLESSFPFLIKKNKKIIKVDNLLDENLCLFDGISTFEGVVEDGLIKNSTKEYYIGGRKASYAKPYYIGKLLNIIDNNGNCILSSVTEYSFSKIKIKDIVSGTPVVVTHLRIPPHYQMGGMVYVNRIRKNIVDEIKSSLK
jgi:hypothetical protein